MISQLMNIFHLVLPPGRQSLALLHRPEHLGQVKLLLLLPLCVQPPGLCHGSPVPRVSVSRSTQKSLSVTKRSTFSIKSIFGWSSSARPAFQKQGCILFCPGAVLSVPIESTLGTSTSLWRVGWPSWIGCHPGRCRDTQGFTCTFSRHEGHVLSCLRDSSKQGTEAESLGRGQQPRGPCNKVSVQPLLHRVRVEAGKRFAAVVCSAAGGRPLGIGFTFSRNCWLGWDAKAGGDVNGGVGR